MSSAMNCEECGTVLEERDVNPTGWGNGDWKWFCPNDDCLSVTGDKLEAHIPVSKQVAAEIEASVKEGYRPTAGAKQLAEDHWKYIESILTNHLVSEQMIEIAGFHYKTAFVHGYKHALEGD